MTKKTIVECPGCGVKLVDQHLPLSERYNATGECLQLNGELTAYNLSRGDLTFIHQMAVDAYGAQHSGGMTRNITTAFALIGLYLAIERGFTGRQVQRAHMELAKQKFTWPRIEPPDQTCALTVLDVLSAEPGEPRDVMLKRWAASVWESWEYKHAWVKNICGQLLKEINFY